MPQKPSLLSLYGYLPKKNCGECEYPTCMAFAAKILEGKAKVEDCPHMTEENRVKVEGLIAAPVAKLTFGTRKPLVIGEARVMHRHELKFYNPTAIAVELNDRQCEADTEAAVERALGVKVERLGEAFGMDSIAISSSTEEAEPFAEVTGRIVKTTDLPLILCCRKAETLKAGLEACGDETPLIFTATRDTLDQYIELAKSHRAPLVVADEDLGQLRLMVKKASDRGLDVALHPLTSSLRGVLEDCITVRRAAIEYGIREFGHPIIGVPASLVKNRGPNDSWWRESLVASALVLRYADAVILKDARIESMLPIITLRHGLFSDPRVPAKVKPGLHRLGSPKPESPVLLTVNYALTFYLVSGDIDKAGLDCYLLVADTGGMSVLNALVGGQLQPKGVAELIKETNLESTVGHRRLIIPGLAARLRGEIEELSDWEVLVGPVESREIPLYLKCL